MLTQTTAKRNTKIQNSAASASEKSECGDGRAAAMYTTATNASSATVC